MTIKCPKCDSENTDTARFCSNCATSLQLSEDILVHTKTLEVPKEELSTGSTFAGRYQIIEELGRGGMGRVYKATDTEIKEKIALKLIKPEISSDKKTIERFQNELKLARKISHRNVCRMHDIGKSEGNYFITMEYVGGENLKGMIRMMGQLSSGKAISIAKQVCEGLSEAHRIGVVHRDLKPSNIMIDKDGNAKIMDFGIARSLSGKGITGVGVMIGTPDYMSPEQVESKEVDQRSDVYSLGVILYEMVTGRVPFEGDTPYSIGVKHKSEVPRNPKDINPQISDDLNRMILKCLEKEKDKRYQSAGELRSELENIEKGMPTTDRVIPERKAITSKEITVTFGLKKLLVPAVIFIAIIAIAVIVWQSLPQRQASIAVLPFRDLSPQKDQEHLCDGMTDEIIAKLSTLQGWKVMNMTSVLRYKNTEKTIKAIGQELNVTTVLLGSVRKEEDDIRVTTQLVNVEDDFQLWSNTYEQKLERVFDIQSDVAEKIAEALKVKLTPEDKTLIQQKPTENLRAYNLYTQGRYFFNKRTNRDYQKAIDYYEQAIKEDPNYALAYSGIADSYILLTRIIYTGLGFPKAKEAIQKALEIDDTLGEAHASLALLNYLEWNWGEADREFKRALELNPNYARAHHWYAEYLSDMGRFDESIEEILQALELSPFDLPINRDSGMCYYSAHNYDQAIEALKRTIAMNQNFPFCHWFLGQTYLQKSMYEEALEEFEKEKHALRANKMGLYQLGLMPDYAITYARMGRKEDVQKMMKMIEPVANGLPYSQACFYFSIGRDDKGFEWLEKAYELRNLLMTGIKVEPHFDSVRSDPRFKALLKKMNLE